MSVRGITQVGSSDNRVYQNLIRFETGLLRGGGWGGARILGKGGGARTIAERSPQVRALHFTHIVVDEKGGTPSPTPPDPRLGLKER